MIFFLFVIVRKISCWSWKLETDWKEQNVLDGWLFHTCTNTLMERTSIPNHQLKIKSTKIFGGYYGLFPATFLFFCLLVFCCPHMAIWPSWPRCWCALVLCVQTVSTVRAMSDIVICNCKVDPTADVSLIQSVLSSSYALCFHPLLDAVADWQFR
jgi:hypothetical protein